jgi:hypothetical protein
VDGAKSEKPPDPLGKRALYRVPTVPGRGGDTSTEELPPDAPDSFPGGRQALYSGASLAADSEVTEPAVAEPVITEPVEPVNTDKAGNSESPAAVGSGSFTVRCQRCRQVSHVGLLNLLIFQLPIGVWLPRGQFDRRMTCPSCRKRSWCSVTLRRG